MLLFLSNNITHYYRACDHLTKILTFNYIMLPDYIPQKEANKKIKNSKTKSVTKLGNDMLSILNKYEKEF